MNRLLWWAVELAARPLEPDERTAVLGDLAESEGSGGRALVEVLGLVLRRQLVAWRRWQPWAALLGVACLAGYYLSQLVFHFDAGSSLQIRTYWKYGVRYRQGVSAAQDVVTLILMLLALIVWSWTSGFVLASLSQRSMWLTGACFYLVVTTAFLLELLSNGNVVYAQRPSPLILLVRFLPLSPGKICFVAAAGLGLAAGRRQQIHLGTAVGWAVAFAAPTLVLLLLWTGSWYEAARETWSNGSWHATPWTQRIVPLLIMSWPLIYLLRRSQSSGRKLGIHDVSA